MKKDFSLEGLSSIRSIDEIDFTDEVAQVTLRDFAERQERYGNDVSED